MADIKQKVIEAIQKLPDDITYEDIMDVVFIQEKVARSLDDSKNGRVITQEEFEKKVEKRQKNRGTHE